MIGTGHGHANSKILALQSMAEYEFLGVARPDKDDPAIGPAFKNPTWLNAEDILKNPDIEMVAIEFADAERPEIVELRAGTGGIDGREVG